MKHTETILIIGNGTAAFHAAKAIREQNAETSIVIYGEEPSLAYHRPMLTKALLMNKPIEKLLIKGSTWYDEQNIEVHVGQIVEAIEPSSKTVRLANGEIKHYDKLILATGATSFIPPIAGSHLANVYAIRNYRDMKQIEDAMVETKRVVVIGGGVLGLEAAWQIHKAGISVTILELAPKLMVRQLDDQASDLLFERIKEEGMDVFVGVNIEAIEGEGAVKAVRLSDHTVILADLVLMSTGIRANVDLAKAAGIAVNRAIVVDSTCQTSVVDVYAVGDCAEYEGINYGILPEAQLMGVVAGTNAAGGLASYETVSPAILFHGMNTRLYAIGDVGKDSTKTYQTKAMRDEEANTYACYYFVDQVLCGAILLGDTKDMKRVEIAYANKSTLEELFPKM